MKRTLYSIMLFSIITTGCSKYSAREIAGTYQGYTFTNYKNNEYTLDDTSFNDFEILKKNKNIVILGYKIPVDSLSDGHHSFHNGDCYSVIKFDGETLDAKFCQAYGPGGIAYHFNGLFGKRK